ncbi:carboxylating nicotinate-nucleotide diphosphorylase [Thermodesulfobacteriota bacterium]
MNSKLLLNNIRSYLQEDTGHGDITSESIFPQNHTSQAIVIAKGTFVLAGIEIASLVFNTQNPSISCTSSQVEGNEVQSGTTLLSLHGPTIDLLKAERVALNLLQRMSGIATLTAQFVNRVKGFPVHIVDTRKTAPGLRMLDKYAVRIGGGHNHRFNLSDGILIKDNHIAASGSIHAAVKQVRNHAPHTLKIEVETETLAQVEECLAAAVDIIMLDNMNFDEMKQAVTLAKGKALLEASGGVTLDNVRKIAKTGVDIISVGALTHSAKACDISMDFSETAQNPGTIE